MGTHLSKTAGHVAVALTLAVGAAGAVALPAWAASHGKSPAQHRTGHAPAGAEVGSGGADRGPAASKKVSRTTSTKVESGTVVLGPATRYVRHKDGSIHRVQ